MKSIKQPILNFAGISIRAHIIELNASFLSQNNALTDRILF